MIPIQNMIYDVMRKLERMETGKCLDLRPYKRDRQVIIEKIENGYNIYEDGFIKEEYLNLSKEEVEKLLEVIKKREFPRSNIVRISMLNKLVK